MGVFSLLIKVCIVLYKKGQNLMYHNSFIKNNQIKKVLYNSIYLHKTFKS